MQITGRKVIVSHDEVDSFNRVRPGSRILAIRSYWFAFDCNGDLVDTDVPERDDGPEAAEMARACKAYLFDGVRPDWSIDALSNEHDGSPFFRPVVLHAAPHGWRFAFGQRVRKIRGSSWRGPVCGFYTTETTKEGYAVESEHEPGSVQIWPADALEAIDEEQT